MKQRNITPHLLSEFKKMLYESEKSTATIEKYMRDVRCFADFTKGRTINKSLVIEYKAKLGDTYALTSANSMLAAINSFLHFTEWDDCRTRQFKIQKNSFCDEEKELTRSEYVALVKAAEAQGDKRLSLLLQTICSTGIRVSELGNVTVEAVIKGEATVRCKGKSRRIFIVSLLRKKLLSYANQRGIRTGMIFVTKSGKPIDRSNVWSEMKKLCKKANVSPQKVFPHNLRHLFARTFYNVEKDIAKLADILGHSSINTTRIYTISSGAEHRKKVENMRLIV